MSKLTSVRKSKKASLKLQAAQHRQDLRQAMVSAFGSCLEAGPPSTESSAAHMLQIMIKFLPRRLKKWASIIFTLNQFFLKILK